MPLPSHHGTRPSLLKRKRTYSDEEQENNPPSFETQSGQVPLERWEVPAECAQIMFSPDSIASSELCSETEPASGHHTPLECDGSQSEYHYTPASCHERLSPMPLLTWADSKEVWELMCHKDIVSMGERDEDMFLRHPFLTARMRSILLDWLIEVCEVYKLHRETYHLTMDFIDRYLSCQRNIPKQQLQLIGITCLFIAAKVEEIYPPKIAEFAYVTDGACTEGEIMDKELAILKTLNWNLSPVTANNWLNMYLQLLSSAQRHQEEGDVDLGVPDTFVFPQYSGLNFVQTAQLLDLCMLDEGCLRFQYGTLAASAIYFVFNHETSLYVSGLQWSDIADCVRWMSAFALTLREECSEATLKYEGSWEDSTSSGLLKTVPRIVVDDSHNIQSHCVDMKLLEKAQERLERQANTVASPVLPIEGLLTPPSSHKKGTNIQNSPTEDSNT